MQHIRPSSKGDPLCPLGFHPQVRWPTRCKRCFRDYKEHGGGRREGDSALRKGELTLSTPTLSTDESPSWKEKGDARSWTSSANLSVLGLSDRTTSRSRTERNEEEPTTTVSLTLPRRRRQYTDDSGSESGARGSTDSSTHIDYTFQVKGPARDAGEKGERKSSQAATASSRIQEELDRVREELETVKARCEKAERDLIDKRMAALDSGKTESGSRLQSKLQEMREETERLKEEKRVLAGRLREAEAAADPRADHLTEENSRLRQAIRDMEEEMQEMHDSFREDQADEYSSLKKELDQTTKKCRILTFKLRKSERKNEQLDLEKLELEKKVREIAGGQAGLDKAERIRKLEHELSVANESAAKLQRELEEAQSQLKESDGQVRRRAPKLGTIPKTPSGERMSRDSVVGGGSHEDPAQLQRDLHDSLEREADLREQLRYAEEQAESLRKKASRVEDDNESLVMQLKKMATRTRSRRVSPTGWRGATPDKDEGFVPAAEEEETAELRIQLDLAEQEGSTLRRRLSELEGERNEVSAKAKILEERLAQYKSGVKDSDSELRARLTEKEKECESLKVQLAKPKKPPPLSKSKSLDMDDGGGVDLKRQLQLTESEAAVLRSRVTSLETENDKLSAENRRMVMTRSRRGSSQEPPSKTETDSMSNEVASPDLDKLKIQLKKSETGRKKLEETLRRLKEDGETLAVLNKRNPRQPTEASTKLQLKRMVEDSELEITELLMALKKAEEKNSPIIGADTEKDRLESTLKKTKMELEKRDKELDDMKGEMKSFQIELSKMKKETDAERIKLTKEKKKLEESKSQLENSKSDTEKELETLKESLKNFKQNAEELAGLRSKLDTLGKTLDEERKAKDELEKKLSSHKSLESEMSKLQSEMVDKQSETLDLEQKAKELEEKLKKSERLTTAKKEKLVKLEKELNERNQKFEELQKEVSSLQNDKKSSENRLVEAERKLNELKTELATKTKVISDTANRTDLVSKARVSPTPASEEVKKIKQECEEVKTKLLETSDKLKEAEKKLSEVEDIAKENKKEHSKEIRSWEQKLVKLEDSLQESIKEAETKVRQQAEKDKAVLLADLNGKEETEERLEKAEKSHQQTKAQLTKEKEALHRMQLEVGRLQAMAQETQTELLQVSKENSELHQQTDRLRKDNEEIRHQVEDYEKVIKVQRSFTQEREALEKELKETRTKLVMEEKKRKRELASVKTRYEGRVAALSNELLGLQGEVARLSRERRRNQSMDQDEDEEEDAAEARAEVSRLSSELLSERSAWQLKVADLTSKLNQLEEEKVSWVRGGSRVTGVKSRLELAWQREREEQQRLLQETSTLARDLRQTLFEVERERDRERLDCKRRIDQVKKTAVEEIEDTRKKLQGVMSDLVELRDSHAKVRTANEKLRREREALRSSLAERARLQQVDERTIIAVNQLVEELTVVAPELFPSKPRHQIPGVAPTPPLRRKSRSREASPLLERRDLSRESSVGRDDTKSQEVHQILHRLNEAALQLKKFSRPPLVREGSADSRDSDLLERRRRMGRSMSQTLPGDQGSEADWSEVEGSLSSVHSVDDRPRPGHHSLDSRLSGGSTRSEMVTAAEKKKKSGLFGKLKKLTKSKSVESEHDLNFNSQVGSESSVVGEEERASIKDKISGMFRKSGSVSRGNSEERTIRRPADSLQRPLVSRASPDLPTQSNSSTTPRPSGRPPSSSSRRKAAN